MKELALLFLKLGTTAFGGPAAHIAMMEEEVVRRRKWLTAEEFLDLLGATNLIPGPNSTEMAIHIGKLRGGYLGLAIAGGCFILPAMSMVLVLAWFYTNYGRLPEVQGILVGIKPVIIAVIGQAIWNLLRTSRHKPIFLSFVGMSALASLLGFSELPLLLLFGLLFMIVSTLGKGQGAPKAIGISFIAITTAKSVAWAAPLLDESFTNSKLFVFFLKVGSVLYGSGYVLLAFLQGELVEKFGWLSESQLLDAIAVGQFTPGPVFTTATFIGYLLSGTTGALVATAGIFLPSFFFVAISSRWIPWIRKTPPAAAFFDGVNAVSLGLMIAVTGMLGREAIGGFWTLSLTLVSALLLIRWNINSMWLILAGAVFGGINTFFIS